MTVSKNEPTYRLIWHQAGQRGKIGFDQENKTIIADGEGTIIKCGYNAKKLKPTEGTTIVVHDNGDGNQDPYIWNDNFINTYCKIENNKLKKIPFKDGDVNFWVFGKKKSDISGGLFCDVVFHIEKIMGWESPNYFDIGGTTWEKIFGEDSELKIYALREHYKDYLPYFDHFFWASYDHHNLIENFQRKSLVGSKSYSFQPQEKNTAANHPLPNILDILNEIGGESLGVNAFKKSDCLEVNPKIGQALYNKLNDRKKFTQLRGSDLKKFRQKAAEKGISKDPFRKRAPLPDYYPQKQKNGSFSIKRTNDGKTIPAPNLAANRMRVLDVFHGGLRETRGTGNNLFAVKVKEPGGGKVKWHLAIIHENSNGKEKVRVKKKSVPNPKIALKWYSHCQKYLDNIQNKSI